MTDQPDRWDPPAGPPPSREEILARIERLQAERARRDASKWN